MGYNFFIIGGDKRILYLAQDLKEEKNNIKLYGFDKLFDNEEIFEDDDFKMAKSLNEIDKNDIIISAFPMSFDGESIYLTAGDGANHVSICRYVDADHIEVDGKEWMILDFARRMHEIGISYAPFLGTERRWAMRKGVIAGIVIAGMLAVAVLIIRERG